MGIRKRFSNKNGRIDGEIIVETSITRYRVCLLEGGELVDERSGLAPLWSMKGENSLTIGGKYFRAFVRFTQDEAYVIWEWPKGDEPPASSFDEIRRKYGL